VAHAAGPADLQTAGDRNPAYLALAISSRRKTGCDGLPPGPACARGTL